MKKNRLKKQVKPASASPKRRTLESVMKEKFETITLTEDVVVNDGDWLLHAGDTLFVAKGKSPLQPKAKKVVESSGDQKKSKEKGEDEGMDVTNSIAIDDEDELGEPLDLEGDGELEDEDSSEEGEGHEEPDGDEEDKDGDEDSEDEDSDEDSDFLDDLDLEDDEDDEDDSDEDDEDDAIDLLTTRKKEESRSLNLKKRSA
jgi:hypothetical protein